MPLRLSAALALSVLALGLLGASRTDPVSVDVEGVVPVTGATGTAPQDAAFRAALLEAVVEVARQSVTTELFERNEDEIRAALTGRATSFVLTYRITGSLERRLAEDPEDPEDPEAEEFVLPVNATVDARQVREFLERRGLLGQSGPLPSLALKVVPGSGLESAEAEGPLAGLRQHLVRELEGRELVVVEPALRVTPLSGDESALELARALGADLGLEVVVGWRPSFSGVRGGVAEVRVRAIRAADGADLALARYEGAGYHALPEEALVRALEAVRDQVVNNLVLQLSRNWAQLARISGPVDLVLLDVQSLIQVEAVRDTLEGALSAEEARLIELAPARARLRVVARLSPGALQDRLTSAVFDGFRLEPVAVETGRVSLRIRSEASAASQLQVD